MNVLPELVGPHIIGQLGVNASGVFGVLGVIRSPGWLPSAATGFFFETHWLYWLGGLLVAGALVYAGKLREDPRLRTAGLIAAAAVIVWAALAELVVTPRERLYRAHQEMATAAEKGDVDKLVSFLEPDFHCSVLGIQQISVARSEISSRLKAYGIRESYIRSYHSDISGDSAYTTMTILTKTAGGPVLTTWGLSWDDVPREDWRIRNADLLKLGNEKMEPGSLLPR